MTCSRNWLGVGVAAVILADIGTNAVCSAGRFCRHRAFVVVSCSRDWLGVSVAAVILADIGTKAVCSAGGFCRHRAFVVVSCSRDWLGVGVAAVILADISADTVCSAGGFDSHGAFVSMSEWVRCSAANCANPSACASCRSAPLMFSAWIRSILTTFLAKSMIPMPLRVFIFILIAYRYPFTTSIAPGAIRICRCWQHHQHHAQRKQDAQKSFFHIVSSQ